jgi:hypothetical protein
LGWHTDVDEHHVRLVLADHGKQLGPVARLPDHVEARALEQARKALPQQDVVIGQRYPWGCRHRHDYL